MIKKKRNQTSSYTVKIYVNGILKLTQEGLSPFAGFHTIKLNEYVPIKKGDKFNVEMTSNAMPITFSRDYRVHYTKNLPFITYGNFTYDLYSLMDAIACLKVYTVADDSRITGNKDLSVIMAISLSSLLGLQLKMAMLLQEHLLSLQSMERQLMQQLTMKVLQNWKLMRFQALM